MVWVEVGEVFFLWVWWFEDVLDSGLCFVCLMFLEVVFDVFGGVTCLHSSSYRVLLKVSVFPECVAKGSRLTLGV